MKHTAVDCYGVSKFLLDDIKLINEFLCDLVFHLGLEAIAPPTIIPYYYGKIKEDIGVSSYVLLSCGHVTIHTFPLRECYFLDVFSKDSFDDLKLKEFLAHNLPYEGLLSQLNSSNREPNKYAVIPYDETLDFGPHLMLQIDNVIDFSMEEAYDFLEYIAYEIKMDPITRANVIKDKVYNPKFISGIIVIAQSHISLHYNCDNKRIYFDIFSCMPFDYRNISVLLSSLGDVKSNVLIPRGTKHNIKIKDNFDSLEAYSKWQKTIIE